MWDPLPQSFIIDAEIMYHTVHWHCEILPLIYRLENILCCRGKRSAITLPTCRCDLTCVLGCLFLIVTHQSLKMDLQRHWSKMNIYYYIISVATVTLVWAEGEYLILSLIHSSKYVSILYPFFSGWGMPEYLHHQLTMEVQGGQELQLQLPGVRGHRHEGDQRWGLQSDHESSSEIHT